MTTLSPSSPGLLNTALVVRKPTRRNRGDRIFFRGITIAVLFVPLLVLLFLGVLLAGARPAVKAFGWKFFITSQWDANAEGGEAYGAFPFVWRTLVTALF